MLHMAVLAAEGTGKITVPVVPLIITGCLLVVLALMWAKRTWPFELFFVAIPFFLLGGWIGVPVVAWLQTVGQG